MNVPFDSDKSYFYDGAGYAMRWGPKSVKPRTAKQKAKRTARRKAQRARAKARTNVN